MALIEWTDRMMVHVEEIDRQHQELIAILNDLNLAMSDGRDKESVSWTLGALTAYAKFHFGFEENFLAQHEYPDAHEHTLEHRMFVRTLGEFRAAHSKGTAGLSVGVLAYLGDWLSNHITATDQRYAPHVIANGAL